MTNIELKAQIDSQITNETTPNGITPTDVGTNLKSIVDYTDQEVSDLDTRVAEYFDDNVFGNYGSFTDETTTAPYPQLPYRVNYCLGSGSPSKISLPNTALIGEQVYLITGFNQTLYAKSDGSGVFLSASTNSSSNSFSLLANKGYRFTYLGSHLGYVTWIAETLGL